jgi:hypothetical protein
MLGHYVSDRRSPPIRIHLPTVCHPSDRNLDSHEYASLMVDSSAREPIVRLSALFASLHLYRPSGNLPYGKDDPS